MKKSTVKKSSLSLNFENLIHEWDYDRNHPLVLRDFTRGSHKKIFWKCKKGHEWVAEIHNRVKGQSCPYCSGKKISKENSIAFNHPNLIKEWDYDKNIGLKPEEVFEFSNFKVWWICNEKHSFLQSISKRSGRGTGCPFCSGRLPTKNNCLLTKHPKLCKEWDYEKTQKDRLILLPILLKECGGNVKKVIVGKQDLIQE